MSDEIELQRYLTAIRQRWWLPLLFVLTALGVTLVVSIVQPKRYQATATLLALGPRYSWKFDDGIEPVVDVRRDYQRDFLALTRSEAVAQQAAEDLTASGQGPAATVADLMAAVTVRTGEGSAILVSAVGESPESAAARANAWAAAAVQAARRVSVDKDLLNGYQAELETANSRLKRAAEMLAQTRATSGLYAETGFNLVTTSLNQRQLDLISQRLAAYLTDLASVEYLVNRLQAATPGQDLALLPWELLSGPVLSSRAVLSPDLARRSLDDPQALLALLIQERQSLSVTADRLRQEAADLQQALARDWQLQEQVQREYDLVQETHRLLASKVDEAAIQQRIDPSQLALVGEAVPPAKPLGTRVFGQLAVAASIGLILGVLAALWLGLRSSIRGPREQAATVP